MFQIDFTCEGISSALRCNSRGVRDMNASRSAQIIVAFGVGLVGGTIGALYPALRAARQDAVEALADE